MKLYYLSSEQMRLEPLAVRQALCYCVNMDTGGIEQAEQERPATGRQGWWLATKRKRAEWQSLSAAGVATFTGRPRDNFTAALPGDPMLIYVATPDKAIRAAGIVLPRANEQSSSIEVQLAFEIPNPLPWREIVGSATLAEAEPVRQRSSGSLFYLSPADYETMRGMILERNPELAAAFSALDNGQVPILRPDYAPPRNEGRVLRESPAAYAVAEETEAAPVVALPAVRDLHDLSERTFLAEATLRDMRDLLLDAGQIVLTGPPGTGKTWLARGLAALVAGDPARVRVTQFHPSTSYEDFVEGLKPRVNAWGQVTYAVLPGLFARFCALAREDAEHRYVLVVDEINRAPLARVFGELLYALEYRGPQGAVALSASAGSGAAPSFYVPENVLLIGTMNSADRSIALVDYALRRRFRFVELQPSGAVLDAWLAGHAVSARRRAILVNLLAEVNRRLEDALGPDFSIGQSYFMLPAPTKQALDRLWTTALRPLLIEYFLPSSAEVDEYASLFATAAAALDAVD